MTNNYINKNESTTIKTKNGCYNNQPIQSKLLLFKSKPSY